MPVLALAALVVAVYQDTRQPLDAAALRVIGRTVADIWRPYATVTLVPAADVVVAEADDVLTVRITDRRSSSGDGLGWIDFVDGAPSRTIYVSRTEVARLAERGTWGGRPVSDWPPSVRDAFSRRAMATAIAHEIGHFLLRSTAHTPTGLMRASLTVEDVMRGLSARDGLDARERAAMQDRVRGYLIARSASPTLATQ